MFKCAQCNGGIIQLNINCGGIVQQNLHSVVGEPVLMVDHPYDNCAVVSCSDLCRIVIGLPSWAQDIELRELLSLLGSDHHINKGDDGSDYG